MRKSFCNLTISQSGKCCFQRLHVDHLRDSAAALLCILLEPWTSVINKSFLTARGSLDPFHFLQVGCGKCVGNRAWGVDGVDSDEIIFFCRKKNHFVVHLKLTQYCYSTLLQNKIEVKKKEGPEMQGNLRTRWISKIRTQNKNQNGSPFE